MNGLVTFEKCSTVFMSSRHHNFNAKISTFQTCPGIVKHNLGGSKNLGSVCRNLPGPFRILNVRNRIISAGLKNSDPIELVSKLNSVDGETYQPNAGQLIEMGWLTEKWRPLAATKSPWSIN